MGKKYVQQNSFVKHKNHSRLSSIKLNTSFNPLCSNRTNSSCIAKISILKYEGIIKKTSYERRAYESVDEKSLRLCPEKTTKKRIEAVKG